MPHQNLWRLSDPAEFAKAYASGDSPAQKAFAQLHGKEPLQFHAEVRTGETDAGPQITPAYYSVGDIQLVRGGPTVTENGNPGPWAASTWQSPQFSPERSADLINKEYLWFDPTNGWSTSPDNIKQSTSFLDRALPMVFAGVMTFATAGAFLFGYAKPVPVNFGRLRNPKRDMVWVALAGPGANLFQSIAWTILLYVLVATGVEEQFFLQMCRAGVLVNLVMFAFNLFPLPPLDGGRILVGLLPLRQAELVSRIEPWGFFIVMALVISGVVGNLWLRPLMMLTESAIQVLLTPLRMLIL
eukprot:gene18062-36820_t